MKALIGRIGLHQEEQHVFGADAELRNARIVARPEQIVQHQMRPEFAGRQFRTGRERFQRIGLAGGGRLPLRPLTQIDSRADDAADGDVDGAGLAVDVLDGRREDERTMSVPLFQQHTANFAAATARHFGTRQPHVVVVEPALPGQLLAIHFAATHQRRCQMSAGSCGVRCGTFKCSIRLPDNFIFRSCHFAPVVQTFIGVDQGQAHHQTADHDDDGTGPHR